jgi:hypothetical protein
MGTERISKQVGMQRVREHERERRMAVQVVCECV